MHRTCVALLGRVSRLALASLLALHIVGCSRQHATTAEAAPASPASTAVAPANAGGRAAAPALPACELVTAFEMSAIMGTELRAIPTPPRGNKSECTYMPPEGAATYATIAVSPGEGVAAMQGLGAAGNIDPALARSLEGLGDQAVMTGEMLEIRVGADLVQITLSGVDDVPGRARRVFDTLRAKR